MNTPPGKNSLLCHINLAKDFRGGERQTELLIRDLARRGWRQRLVARRGAALGDRCQGIDGLEIREVASNPLTASLAARGSDIVHAHEARSVYAGWLLSRAAAVPYLLTRRVDNPFKPSVLRRFAYAGADDVVCLSNTIMRRVVEQYPSIQCRVVPSAHAALANGSHDRAVIRQKYHGKTIIGHVGALVQRHKGQRTIIAAARSAEKSQPDWHFLLVGSGEDEQEFLRDSQGLTNIECTGQVDNIADYLAAFHIFVFPSLHEGFGSSLLDAMSFGLPLVASNVGGIAELLDDSVNGILIPPNDSAALLDALRKLCDSPELRNSMREANLLKAAKFGADRMGDAYERIYLSILERRRKN